MTLPENVRAAEATQDDLKELISVIGSGPRALSMTSTDGNVPINIIAGKDIELTDQMPNLKKTLDMPRYTKALKNLMHVSKGGLSLVAFQNGVEAVLTGRTVDSEEVVLAYKIVISREATTETFRGITIHSLRALALDINQPAGTVRLSEDKFYARPSEDCKDAKLWYFPSFDARRGNPTLLPLVELTTAAGAAKRINYRNNVTTDRFILPEAYVQQSSQAYVYEWDGAAVTEVHLISPDGIPLDVSTAVPSVAADVTSLNTQLIDSGYGHTGLFALNGTTITFTSTMGWSMWQPTGNVTTLAKMAAANGQIPQHLAHELYGAIIVSDRLITFDGLKSDYRIEITPIVTTSAMAVELLQMLDAYMNG